MNAVQQQRAPAAVPVVLWIDAETDANVPARDDRSDWSGFARCYERLGAYRARLEEATSAAADYNWAVRADPQVAEIYGDSAWGLIEYRRVWQGLLARGDDVGLHPHMQRWSEAEARWFGGQEDPEWAQDVLRAAHGDYCRVLDRAPLTVRFGNRYLDQGLADLASELGFLYDTTIEPGRAGRNATSTTHALEGDCPGYHHAPQVPYRAAWSDFLAPDPARTTGMWFVPLSTAPRDPAAARPQRPDHHAAPHRKFGYRTLNLRHSPEWFAGAVSHLLDVLPRPYLAVVLRSQAIDQPEVWANLEFLRTHDRARPFVFTTTARALRILGCEPDATCFSA